MPKIHVTEAILPQIRHAIRQAIPSVGSSHLTESLAFGAGFRNNAALLTAMRTMPPSSQTLELDPTALAARLTELGHSANHVKLQAALADIVAVYGPLKRARSHIGRIYRDNHRKTFAVDVPQGAGPRETLTALIAAMPQGNARRMTLFCPTPSTPRRAPLGWIQRWDLPWQHGFVFQMLVGNENLDIAIPNFFPDGPHMSGLESLRRELFLGAGGRPADYRYDLDGDVDDYGEGASTRMYADRLFFDGRECHLPTEKVSRLSLEFIPRNNVALEDHVGVLMETIRPLR